MRDLAPSDRHQAPLEWSPILVERFFVTISVVMRALLDVVLRIAASEAPVVVLGETGAGKDLAAAAVHARSGRAQGPFIALNCAAIPEELLEALLFGAEEGAFSGCVRTMVGLFQLAHGGTLFLDEIGELPLHLQPKLLRALETRRVWRLGGREPIAADVRVVCATNRNLREMVEQGTFRADLYYRLAVFVVRLPALRDRMEDLPHLAESFVSGKLTAAALALLKSHDWPGNVRELKNVLERAGALAARPGVIDAGDISFDPDGIGVQRPTFTGDLEDLMAVGPGAGWRQDHAAQLLGWSPAKVSRLLSRDERARSYWNAQRRAANLEDGPTDSHEL